MNDFTASNGLKVSHLDGDGLRVAIPPDGYERWQKINLHASSAVALREFFQAEADERLGRWRWPENPQWLLYPDDDGDVVALDESTGQSTSLLTRLTALTPNAEGCPAARAYFDAHPEPKQEWHDAQIGDVWVMEPLSIAYTVVGGHEKWFTRGDVFGETERRELMDPAFTGGRRIWPEVSS